MQGYLSGHLAAGGYTEVPGAVRCYRNAQGWEDWFVTDKLLFSHRVTPYTKETFRETFHDHTYYELNICRAGDVCFFCNEKTVTLQHGLICLLRPNTVHTGKLLTPSLYDRYILYFDADALSFLGAGAPLIPFTAKEPQFFGLLDERGTGEMFALLEETEKTLSAGGECAATMALAAILRLFALITDRYDRPAPQSGNVPEIIQRIREYVDAHFTEIDSVGEIAARFSYSKEYLSRLFKKYYNGHIYNYLIRKKISFAIAKIEEGASVTDACYLSGFNNMTSFIRYFRLATGTTPTGYRQSR